ALAAGRRLVAGLVGERARTVADLSRGSLLAGDVLAAAARRTVRVPLADQARGLRTLSIALREGRLAAGRGNAGALAVRSRLAHEPGRAVEVTGRERRRVASHRRVAGALGPRRVRNALLSRVRTGSVAGRRG